MKKNVIGVVVVVVALIIGAVGGYLFKSSRHTGSTVLPDGNYKVVATWNWKKLSVNGNRYTLDDTRNYDILVQDKQTGIVVMNSRDAKKKTTQIYKIIKTGNQYKWHVVAKGVVSEKVAATMSKD